MTGDCGKWAARIVSSAIAAAALVAAPAFGSEVLGDDELSEMRGGYISAAGIQFDFGATLQTYVDGVLALASTLTVSDSGVSASQQVGDVPNARPLSDAAAAGLNLGQPQGSGIVIPGTGGATALIHDVTGTQLRNIVVNTAQDRIVVQHTDLTFTIPNLSSIQTQMQLNRMSAGLEQALGFALQSAASH